MTERNDDARLYIGGKWVSGSSGRTFTSTNPATGEVLGRLVEGDSKDVDAAVDAAQQAKRVLRRSSVEERAAWCESIAEAMRESADELASLLSREQGKPLAEADGEVHAAIKGFSDSGGHIRHLHGTVHHASDPNRIVLSRRVPRGVYAIITPWNFPINIPVEYIGPALATGNAVVWIPAPSTSLVAVRLTELIDAAGIPAGAVNLVTGYGPVVGDSAVTHSGVDGIGFTGSTATGMSIAQRAPQKPKLLELGGNGPTIVLADADLDAAAEAVALAAFENAGQTCASTELVLVERSVQEEFARKLCDLASKVKLGEGIQDGISMGPLNNEATAAKMEIHIADAVSRGARLGRGGSREVGHGSELFFSPTVLFDVSSDALLVTEESFGPIIPLLPVDSLEEAIELSHQPQFGLVGALWTRDVSKAFYAAEHMQHGIVNINAPSSYWEIHIPFGGGTGTDSGEGRIGGMETLYAMTEIRTVTFDATTFGTMRGEGYV